MALDPESQNLLNLMAAANRPAWVTLSPPAAREQYLSTRAPAQGPLPQGVTVTNRTILGPTGAIAVRLYRPDSAAAEAKLPALVFAHGGGWVFGNLDSHDVLCAQLAIGSGLNAVTMEWFFDHYTPQKGERADWRVSPLRATSLAGLPPALVITAGYDCLRD